MNVYLAGLVCCVSLISVQYAVCSEDNFEYVEMDYSEEDKGKPKPMSAKELMRQAALEVKKESENERATVAYSVISGPDGKRSAKNIKYADLARTTIKKHSRPFYFGDGPEKLKFKPAPEGWPLPEIPEHYYLPPTTHARQGRGTKTGKPGLIYEEKFKGKKIKRRNRRVRKERSADYSDDDDLPPIETMKKKGLGNYWSKLTTTRSISQTVDPRSVKVKDNELLVLKPAPPNWPEPTFPPKPQPNQRLSWQQQQYQHQFGRQFQQQAMPKAKQVRRPPGADAYSFDFKNGMETTYHTLLPRRSRGTGQYYTRAPEAQTENREYYQQLVRTFASKYELRRFQRNQKGSLTTWHTLIPRRRPGNFYNKNAKEQSPRPGRKFPPTYSPKLYQMLCPELPKVMNSETTNEATTIAPHWKKYMDPNLYAFWVKTTTPNPDKYMTTPWPTIVTKKFLERNPEDTEEDELFAMTYWHRRKKGLKPQVDPYMLAMKYEKGIKFLRTKPPTTVKHRPIYRGFFSVRLTTPTSNLKQV